MHFCRSSRGYLIHKVFVDPGGFHCIVAIVGQGELKLSIVMQNGPTLLAIKVLLTGECAPDRALDPAVLSRLKLFSAMNKLKMVALQVNKANEY
ncbi:calcium-dependent protein kinase [Trifolium repens]|nr:calcium-dependent protein kinase [Trifolium repens]